MCGIFGGHPNLLKKNVEGVLRHRGPDQQGEVQFEDRRGETFRFGAVRLSIVTKADVLTPLMVNGACITFNGEIYNWHEIRKELEAKGIRFFTDTDTEVVAQAYLQWGPACLDRFNGPFAIAIWRDGELFLARDRLGKRPLFFAMEGDSFAFASEMKAFKKFQYEEINICEKLEFYFDEFTVFRDIYSIKPGEFILYDTNTRKATTIIWWEYPKYQGSITDLTAALGEFIPLFEDACKLRLRADVPVTLYLSGGLDSSLIQSICRLDHTYTVQFEEYKETIDERSLVEEYAKFLQFETRILTPTRAEFLDSLSLMARYLEMPVGSFSVFPLYYLGRECRRDEYGVALTGDGADELFNGYYRHEMLLEEDNAVQRYVDGPYRDLTRRYFGTRLERFCRMASRGGDADVGVLLELFRPFWSEGAPLVHNLSVIDTKFFMQPLLAMADRMSMASGVETRSPFLDHRIVEFSVKLAPELRYNDGRGKYILWEALKEILGTTEIGIMRRDVKHGLPAPMNQWLSYQGNFDRKEWNQMLASECVREMNQLPN